VTCDDRASEAQRAFERHRLKGDWEQRLGDFQLHHLPCQRLTANPCFYALTTLAYDLLQALKLLYLPKSEALKRVRTLIQHLLLIPVEMGRHARQIKTSLYMPADWVTWWRGLLAELLPKWRQLGVVASSG